MQACPATSGVCTHVGHMMVVLLLLLLGWCCCSAAVLMLLLTSAGSYAYVMISYLSCTHVHEPVVASAQPVLAAAAPPHRLALHALTQLCRSLNTCAA